MIRVFVNDKNNINATLNDVTTFLLLSHVKEMCFKSRRRNVKKLIPYRKKFIHLVKKNKNSQVLGNSSKRFQY